MLIWCMVLKFKCHVLRVLVLFHLVGLFKQALMCLLYISALWEDAQLPQSYM